jgi:aminopeptidase N
MKWWNDLWLNESFAEWASTIATAEATEWTEAWTTFQAMGKTWAYRQDQLPSTHPVVATINDFEDVQVNFDGITYAKGGSVLKQLVAWVGLDPFLAGLRQYFKDHAFGNATFADLLAALEKSSGRELKGWAAEWLQTAGVNTLAPSFELDADGNYASFSVSQSAHPDYPTLRRHRLGVGLYDFDGDDLVRRDYLEVDIDGAETPIAELIGKAQPALLLLNDEDHAYAKIRLDERSLATVLGGGLSQLTDSLPRALVWGAAWDMTRDAEMASSDFVRLVLANIGKETDAWGVTRIPAMAATSVNYYSDPAGRAALKAEWVAGLRALIDAAEAGSDHQLTFVRQWAAAASDDASLDEVAALLSGELVLEGFSIDQEMRWGLLTALASKGRVGDAEIDAELERDNTIQGKEQAAGARVAQPTVEAKEAGWKAILDPETPNETAAAMATSIFRFGQESVTQGAMERYLEAAEHVMDTLGFHKGSTVIEYAFPKQLGNAAVLAQVDAWLESSPAPKSAKRYVSEVRADLARALAAQARDAQ